MTSKLSKLPTFPFPIFFLWKFRTVFDRSEKFSPSSTTKYSAIYDIHNFFLLTFQKKSDVFDQSLPQMPLNVFFRNSTVLGCFCTIFECLVDLNMHRVRRQNLSVANFCIEKSEVCVTKKLKSPYRKLPIIHGLWR